MRRALDVGDAAGVDVLARVPGAVVVAGHDAALIYGPSPHQYCQ